MIILSFLSVFATIFIYTNLQVPYYRAMALIKIEPHAGIPSEIIFPSAANRSRFLTADEIPDYVKQIVGRPILEAAARELGWITDKTPAAEKDDIINKITSEVTADDLEKTNMIRLYVQSKDPHEAADLANKVAIVFKKINLEQKNQQAYNVRVFIEKTLEDVSKKLKDQDERIRVLTMKGVVGSGVNIVNQIYELEKVKRDLLTRYTEKYPEVERADEQIKELKKALSNLPDEEFEYAILKRDIGINEALYTNLRQKLPEAQIKEAEKIDNVLIVNPATAPRTPYYPQKGKNYMMGILLGAILGVSAALVTEHIDTSIGRVEDVENFIKASVLGVIPFCSKKEKDEITKPGRQSAWIKWADFVAKKIIKKKPGQGSAYEGSVSALDHTTGSVFLESFRILSVNLQVIFGKGERIKNKIILITSCNPEEGKSVVTSNLGIVMAQMGYKALIVDADSRRSSIHKVFGLKHKEGGLLDILTDRISVDAATRTATDIMLGSTEAAKIMDRPWLNNLNIITAGTTFPNPINLFNSEKMKELLKYLRNKYDIVLIDTSPILAVSEPSILIPNVDGVLLVYKAGATSRLALRRAKMQIESVKGEGSLAGVILNNVTPEIGVDTYYYYNKRYYGEKELPKGKK